MHVDQVLLLLLNSLTLKSHKLVLSCFSVNLWQEQAFTLMLDNKLITPISTAKNIQCRYCEKNCTLDVIPHSYPNKTRYYAVCEDPIMHEQVGRMTIPPEQLKQWQISIKQLAVLIAELLGLSSDISYKADQKSISLGALSSKAGRKSVVLNVEPLTLVVNQSILPINELLYFEGDKLLLDRDKIEHALNIKQPPATKNYSPNIDKKELRKAKTQAMYQSWQEEYEKLQRENPHKPNQPKKTKGWYAYQISKMPIAQGGSAANITRILKN
ncbi:hypothetical protein [Pseudocolwellia sp. HL-MZ7]|uniref:hypothetical protein n=1 Tax=Pseudocolwellia sp. HL-MZ7 TaxID=3400627 RepID=UPI003CF1B3E8